MLDKPRTLIPLFAIANARFDHRDHGRIFLFAEPWAEHVCSRKHFQRDFMFAVANMGGNANRNTPVCIYNLDL